LLAFYNRQLLIKEGPCRNRGRLPKLTAYEKIENLIFECYFYYFKTHAKSKNDNVKEFLKATYFFIPDNYWVQVTLIFLTLK
jgi:hypothetical protein